MKKPLITELTPVLPRCMVGSSATADTGPASWWVGRGQRATNTRQVIVWSYDLEVLVDGWFVRFGDGQHQSCQLRLRFWMVESSAPCQLDGRKSDTSPVSHFPVSHALWLFRVLAASRCGDLAHSAVYVSSTMASKKLTIFSIWIILPFTLAYHSSLMFTLTVYKPGACYLLGFYTLSSP